MSANSFGEMYYRCLEVTHESLSDGSFEDNKKKKGCYLPCSKIQKIRWCWGNDINTD